MEAASDYPKLLREGYLRRELPVSQHDQWRTAIRRRASQDRLRVRTGGKTHPPHVWAALLDWTPPPDQSESLKQLAADSQPPLAVLTNDV